MFWLALVQNALVAFALYALPHGEIIREAAYWIGCAVVLVAFFRRVPGSGSSHLDADQRYDQDWHSANWRRQGLNTGRLAGEVRLGLEIEQLHLNAHSFLDDSTISSDSATL
jgi:hypothetical protein